MNDSRQPTLGSLLRCPNCGKTNTFDASAVDTTTGLVACNACHYQIPVTNSGIPDLLPAAGPVEEKKKPFTQKVMETRIFAKLYETPIWRPLHTLIGSGMSIDREVARLVELTKRPGEGRMDAVLDLACGTGHFTRALAAAHPEAEIYGLDLSLSMLEEGVAIYDRQGGTGARPIYLRGDIMVLPFADESFDLVNCCGALHLFPDVRPVFAEMARVLKPGGTITGEAVAIGGPLAPIQRRIKARGGASFFEETWLTEQFAEQGLTDLYYERHRVLALFRATKSVAQGQAAA